jgi:Fur family peroxide stress response transcriptional regulator
MNQTEIERRISKFPETCRDAGLKLTHQRMAVYSMLAATDSHPTPEDVYTALRTELPSLSLGTVYKILDQFHKHGFLRRVSTEGHVARYDANMESHHHQICTGCGVIQDVRVNLDGVVPVASDFQVTHFDVIFHGLCPECRQRGA